MDCNSFLFIIYDIRYLLCILINHSECIWHFKAGTIVINPCKTSEKLQMTLLISNVKTSVLTESSKAQNGSNNCPISTKDKEVPKNRYLIGDKYFFLFYPVDHCALHWFLVSNRLRIKRPLTYNLFLSTNVSHYEILLYCIL